MENKDSPACYISDYICRTFFERFYFYNDHEKITKKFTDKLDKIFNGAEEINIYSEKYKEFHKLLEEYNNVYKSYEQPTEKQIQLEEPITKNKILKKENEQLNKDNENLRREIEEYKKHFIQLNIFLEKFKTFN